MRQWLNSWLPLWLFQDLSTANLLKSFFSPLPLHKVPHQLWLDYLSLFPAPSRDLLLSLTLSLTHTHSRNPQSPTRQTNLSPSPHFCSPSLTRIDKLLPLSKPPLHSRFSNLDYLSSLFHKSDRSHHSPSLTETSTSIVSTF